MKHIVSLSPQLELVYVEAGKIIGLPVEQLLEIALAEYVHNLIPKKEKALN